MGPLPADGDVSRIVSIRTRIAHRLARHVRTAPARLAGSEPMVSFTFDDVPDSACTIGADLLQAYSGSGTFYFSGSLIGLRTPFWDIASPGQIAALHEAGHEIGCHTHTHVFVPKLDASSIAAEARRNRDSLASILPGIRLDNFAYPYGYASLPAKRALEGLYRSSRGIATGVNAGGFDRQFLRANPLIDGQIDIAAIERLMDEAVAQRGWLIFYGHDVTDDPSPYGCTPRLLELALRAAAKRGIRPVTIAQALTRLE